ncbi:MAG: Mom family adenine methylcarbamoylation protein [Solirubrobacteraceae bacterium]
MSLEVAVLREATEVIVRNHYLHRGRTMAQLPYWITVDGQRAGVMLFALPRLSVAFQGHHPMRMIELARLWIEPEFQGLHVRDRRGRLHTFALASQSIGGALRRVRSDWADKYPRLPIIEACVAWADLSRHQGTVYRAANFDLVGLSGGKQPGRWSRPNGGSHLAHVDYSNQKACFMYHWAEPEVRPDQREPAA